MEFQDSSVGIDRRRFFSPSRGPFHDAGNLLTFYAGGGRGDVLDGLVANRRSLHGVAHVHGERGSGRTFLSHVLADRLRHACNVIRHESSRSSRSVLLRHLLIELCPSEAGLIDAPAALRGVDEATLARATERVTAQLERAPSGGRPYLLIVDCPGDVEVDPGAVALLERLAGVRRDGHPAMHVVLFRPTDAETARGASARGASLPPRQYWLRRLTLAETGDYLRHRMMLFDFNRRDLFTREMSYFIADHSEGVFGAIDMLARNAFTLAGLEDDERPSMAHLLAVGAPRRAEAVTRVPFLVRHRGLCIALLGLGVVASSAALLAFSA